MEKSLWIVILFCLLSCGKKTPQLEKPTENSFYKKAWTFIDKDQKDSAFYYLNIAKDDYLKKHDSFSAGKCLVNMAIIQEGVGDNFGSLETSLDALVYFKEKDTAHNSFIATNYNNLGINSGSLQDYKQAEFFYRKALTFTKDEEDIVMFLNNYGTTLHQAKHYKEAEKIFENALKKIDSTHFAFSRIEINLARTRCFLNNNYNPTLLYQKSLTHYIKEKDLWGQDISYAYLSDYYMTIDKDLALNYAYKMLSVAEEIKSPNDRLEALSKIIKLEDAPASKIYFDKFQQLDDSLHVANVKTKNQYALVRYDSEKNKVDKLRLQKENISKKYEIVLHQVVIGLLIIAALFLFFFIIMRNKRKQQRLMLETENEIKEHDLITSKKVHDVVANGLYRVMTEIESQPNVDREKLLYKLEDMYEKSRNISYDKIDKETKIDFKESISQLIQSFDSESVKIFIVGNSHELWETILPSTKNEVYHILQELLVNMKKHSQADRLVIKFSKSGNRIKIDYSDNGIGMKNTDLSQNGLRSTGNRIQNINGDIIFETEIMTGLKIHISFPEN